MRYRYAALAFSVVFTCLSAVSAQESSGSFSKEYEKLQSATEKRSRYQGKKESAESVLKSAQLAKPGETRTCPRGSIVRKSADVKEYFIRRDQINQNFAKSIERFTSGEVSRQAATQDFNNLVGQSNDIVIWGRGRVTDGACGPPEETRLISKSIAATKALIERYRGLLSAPPITASNRRSAWEKLEIFSKSEFLIRRLGEDPECKDIKPPRTFLAVLIEKNKELFYLENDQDVARATLNTMNREWDLINPGETESRGSLFYKSIKESDETSDLPLNQKCEKVVQKAEALYKQSLSNIIFNEVK